MLVSPYSDLGTLLRRALRDDTIDRKEVSFLLAINDCLRIGSIG